MGVSFCCANSSSGQIDLNLKQLGSEIINFKSLYSDSPPNSEERAKEKSFIASALENDEVINEISQQHKLLEFIYIPQHRGPTGTIIKSITEDTKSFHNTSLNLAGSKSIKNTPRVIEVDQKEFPQIQESHQSKETDENAISSERKV